VSEADTIAKLKYTPKGLGALTWSRDLCQKMFQRSNGDWHPKIHKFSDYSCFQMLSLMAITPKPNARATPNLQHTVRWIHSIGRGSQPLPVTYSFMLVSLIMHGVWKLITYP